MFYMFYMSVYTPLWCQKCTKLSVILSPLHRFDVFLVYIECVVCLADKILWDSYRYAEKSKYGHLHTISYLISCLLCVY